MPRKPRMYLPEMPYHVVQRGNNRDATFYAEQDYQFYLECLEEACKRYGVLLHAYVLMTNHVHLLMTPKAKDSISLTMQSQGRRYVQYINKEYRRSGTLWESRHKSSLVDADNYLLTLMRYIEMNPVRAKMVKHPGDYKWTSYQCNAEGNNNSLISSHEIYRELSTNKDKRLRIYSELFNNELLEEDLSLIRKSTMFSMPTGDNRFKEVVEKMLKRKLGYTNRGRPTKCLD